MSQRFSPGKHTIADCDRCGFTFKLRQLKTLTIKAKNVDLKVCPECYEQDHPQLMQGMYPVDDPQAVRGPRPDMGRAVSREIQWGWAPVGGPLADSSGMFPNALAAHGILGNVTVEVS